MANMNVDWATVPREIDYRGMREWEQNDFHNFNSKPRCERYQTPVTVTVADVKIEYGDNAQFGVRIYNPQDESQVLRPIIIMYHGGGFTHGDSTSDEGESDPGV